MSANLRNRTFSESSDPGGEYFAPFLPWEKITIFRTEKNNLERLIKENPNNLHLRYIRLVVQENTPKFLNYFSNIELDKKIINQFLSRKDKTDYLDKYIIKNTSL